MSDIISAQSNANLKNNESTTDEIVVSEVEEGVIADDSPETERPNLKMRLSLVSRQYDIDGDGVLDEAELASRLHRSFVLLMHDSLFFPIPRRHN